MKQKFSTSWIGSTQPRKQRKYLINAPLHIRRKLMVSTLSKELRVKQGMRNVEVRKGDEVEVMRGKFDGKKGKVSSVITKKQKVSVEGLQASKRDGTKVNIWFHPSKLKIVTLNMDDKKRFLRQPAESKNSAKSQKEGIKSEVKINKKQGK
jgi:large subunit ribosomal protein L24